MFEDGFGISDEEIFCYRNVVVQEYKIRCIRGGNAEIPGGNQALRADVVVTKRELAELSANLLCEMLFAILNDKNFSYNV